MEDLTKYFPGCTLSNLEIRESIRKILAVEPFTAFYCYRCFCHVNKRAGYCHICYQPYCDSCIEGYLTGPGSSPTGIDPAKCIQCVDNNSTFQ